jgi:protein AroM
VKPRDLSARWRRKCYGQAWFHFRPPGLGNSASRGAAAVKPDGPVALLDHLPDSRDRLTPRERDVLAAVLDGKGNKVIGRMLGISHRTVEIHRARALAKLDASSPTELIRRALIAGDA